MKNIFLIKIAGICLTGLLLAGCAEETWKSHYEANPSLVADKNLWESIAAEPQLSVFAEILKNYGYDKILATSQSYTVFAPSNAALAALDTSAMNVKTELIENHIARFFIPASEGISKVVCTLNNKRILLTATGADRNFKFGSVPFATPAQDIVAKNGLIHVLSGLEPFFPNIYEYLAKRADLDSVRAYIYSFNVIEFDEQASTPGGVVDGQLTYLDSVFNNYNTLLQKLGYINREDSNYTMLVPNNAAWIEAYNRIKGDYVYYNASQATADSMQRINTGHAIVQDLFYNFNLQVSPGDSIYSTSRNWFHNPAELFGGTEEIILSNGRVLITDQLKFKAYQSWQDTIKVEAERSLGRQNTLSSASTVWSNNQNMKISNGGFLYLVPSSSSGNPTVTFDVPNTLSSTYNIYVVFVPSNINNLSMPVQKPNKFYFELAYRGIDGVKTTTRLPATTTMENRSDVLDTVLVAQDFKFPTATYGEPEQTDVNKKNTITLKIISQVARTETNNFSRDFYIDCLLFIPKKD